jgi:hypothetical protein
VFVRRNTGGDVSVSESASKREESESPDFKDKRLKYHMTPTIKYKIILMLDTDSCNSLTCGTFLFTVSGAENGDNSGT